MSQLTRGILVEKVYELKFDKKLTRDKKISAKTKAIINSGYSPHYFISREKLDKDSFDNMVGRYYNYMETCINNIVPILSLGTSFVFYLHLRFNAPIEDLLLPFVVIPLVICGVLYHSGYRSYRRFRIRTAELVLGKYHLVGEKFDC